MKKRIQDSEQSRPIGLQLVIALLGAGLLLGTPFADDGSGGDDPPDEGNNFGDDETIGSLPGMDGDNGIGAGMIDNRPVFYVVGPQSEIDHLITHATTESGAGYYVYHTVSPGEMLYEFHGDLALELDESVLERGLVEIGVRAGFPGSPMSAALAWDGTVSPRATVPAGAVFELPFVRMQSANLFTSALILHTFDETNGQSAFGLDSFGGLLSVRQDT